MSSDLIYSSASTMNWQLAIGDHSIGIRARLYYSSKNKKYTMNYTIYAYDRYNFDKTDGNGNTKTFYGIKDEYNARFVVIGMAKFFTSIGLMEGKITWKG